MLNYNRDPTVLMEVHKNFYLTLIHIIFPLNDAGKESQREDPELLLVIVTKQH